MKTLLKISVITATLLSMIKCEHQNAESGRINVKLTDAPTDLIEVNVDIQSVMIHYDQKGWINLATDTGVYNLLELQDSLTEVIASNGNLPVGHVNQLRLVLGQGNNVMTMDSSIQPLLLSSQDEIGLKLNLNHDITSSSVTEILVDFDASKSVILQGNDEFRLKPHLTLQHIIQL